MKAAILSWSLVLALIWQAPVLGCNKNGSTQGKDKSKPQLPTFGRFPFPADAGPSQAQFVVVPVQADPSNASAPVVYVLVPVSNGQMSRPGKFTPRPSHGRSKGPAQRPVAPSHGMLAGSPSSLVPPSNGFQPQSGSVGAQLLPIQQQVAQSNDLPVPVQQPERQTPLSYQTYVNNSQPSSGDQLAQLWAQMNTAPEGTLKQALQSSDPLYRYMAAQAAGTRKLNFSSELTALLTDSSPYVQQAARQSLASLSETTSK
jgi:hypothetical protein